MGCCGKLKKPKINRPLLPVKAQQFFYYGAVHSMFSYVSIHLRLAGLSIADITIISSFIPIAGIMGGPLIGLCTDIFGRYKLMAGIVLCTTAAIFTSFLFIPLYGHVNHPLEANITCSNQLNLLHIEKCKYQDECSSNTTTSFLKGCQFIHSGNINRTLAESVACSAESSCNDLTFSNITTKAFLYKSQHSSCVYQLSEVNLQTRTNATSRTAVYSSTNQLCPSHCVYSTTDCRTQIGRWEETFYPFLVLRLLGQFFLFSCYSLVDTTTIGALKKHGGQYGKHRIFSHLAQALFPFMSGAIMDAASGGKERTVIWPAYVLFDFCLIVVVLLLLPMTLTQEKIPGSTFKAVKQLAVNKRCFVLFLLAIFGGILPGFMGVFVSIYLRTLTTSMTLIGLTSTSGAVTSIFLMYFSDIIVVRMGYLNVLCTGFLLNALTIFCYSLIQNAWWAVLLGTTRAFTQNVCWVALIKWNGIVAPKGLLSTTLGTIRAFTYGLGRTIGVVSGGALMVIYGDRITFRIFAAFYTSVGVGWLLLYHLLLKRCMEVDSEEDKPIEKPLPHESMAYTNPVMLNEIAAEEISANPAIRYQVEAEHKDLECGSEIPMNGILPKTSITEN